MKTALLVRRRRGAGFNPALLFANGEQGGWFEANDSTTLFTDVAGTTPVTTPGDAIALQLDKSGRGNHRTQATTAARPLYALHPVGGVRNLLQYTEDGSNWTTLNLSQATLDGEITLTENAESSVVHRAFIASDSVSDEANIIRFEVKPNGRTKLRVWVFSGSLNVNIDVENQTLLDKHASMGVPSFSTTPDGFTVVTFTGPSNRIFNQLNFLLLDDAGNASYTGDGTSGLIIRKPQLELGSTATNYQRVGSFLDVSEEGKARRGRLWYNGTSHFMQTPTITPGTDKVQVFAGVRKLSDAARGVLVEHSASAAANNGSLVVTAPDAASATFAFESKGTTLVSAVDTGIAAPATRVLTGLGDISGDSAILRINGVQEAISTAEQGTGNFLAYPLYFGARAGTSLFFGGYEDTSIVRFGPTPDDTTISKVESYVVSKTPEETI